MPDGRSAQVELRVAEMRRVLVSNRGPVAADGGSPSGAGYLSETAGNKETKLGNTVCCDPVEVATCMSRVTSIVHDLRLCLQISRLTSLRLMILMQNLMLDVIEL